MKIGDKVILRDWNKTSIRLLGKESLVGKQFTLKSQHTAASLCLSRESKAHFGESVIWLSEDGWYLPEGCLELVGSNTKFKSGDECKVINHDGELEKANLNPAYHIGKLITLHRKTTARELGFRKLPEHTIVWESMGSWYYPESCLQLVTVTSASAPGVPAQQPTTTKPVSKKENNNMYIFRVSFIQTPTVVAQQSGDVETLLVPTVEVLADNANTAIALAAAQNAEAILKAQGSGKLRVCAAQQACNF